jgi:hypothetical protein
VRPRVPRQMTMMALLFRVSPSLASETAIIDLTQRYEEITGGIRFLKA